MRRAMIGLLLVWSTLAGWAGPRWQLTILHTNDLHGRLLPFSYQGAERGGLARRATLIAQVRRQVFHPLVLIDGGDVFTRGPWHTRYFGVPEIEAMNAMAYDMACVGNNEFKATEGGDAQARFLALVRRSRFPWLAANLTVGATGVPVAGVHPFIVRDLDGVRVGFLGLTAPRARDYPQTRGWTIADPVRTAKQWVPIARKECDILIAVTHIGVFLDHDLARQVPGIDAIVGADTHTFLREPLLVSGPTGRDVPILQAGEQGVMLGRADLTFEHAADGWHLTAATGRLLPIDATLVPDPAVTNLLNRWLIPQPLPLAPAA